MQDITYTNVDRAFRIQRCRCLSYRVVVVSFISVTSVVPVDEPITLAGRTIYWLWSVHWICESTGYCCCFQRLHQVHNEAQIVLNESVLFQSLLAYISAKGQCILWPSRVPTALQTFGGHLASTSTIIKTETVVRWPTTWKYWANQCDAIFRNNIPHRPLEYMLIIVSFPPVSWICTDLVEYQSLSTRSQQVVSVREHIPPFTRFHCDLG